MTLYDFNILSDLEKEDAVFRQGTFVDAIQVNEVKYCLYAIDMFFVEIEYDTKLEKLHNLKSFKKGYLLDRYLDKFPNIKIP